LKCGGAFFPCRIFSYFDRACRGKNARSVITHCLRPFDGQKEANQCQLEPSILTLPDENRVTIQASNLSKTLGALRLFENATLVVNSGGVLLLRGENGSGKTTLLRILAGLMEADSGQVVVHRSMEEMIGDDAPNLMHYLGHANGLKEGQTVGENLSYWEKMCPPDERALSPEDAMDRLDISRLLDLPIQALSAGQRRRSAFARLLISQKPIWLLDEPTAALDSKSSALIEDIVLHHVEQKGLCIAATHLPFLESRSTAIDMGDFAPKHTTEASDEKGELW
jgi:heme exporter protein A